MQQVATLHWKLYFVDLPLSFSRLNQTDCKMKISLCLMFIALPLFCPQMINPNLIAFICKNVPSSPLCLPTTSTTTTTTTPPDPCPQIFSCVDPILEALMNSTSESIMNQTMNLYDSRLLDAERKMDILEQNCLQTTVALQQFMEESRNEIDQLKDALAKSMDRITDIENKIADCQVPNEIRPPIKNGDGIILGELCVPYRCVDGQLLSNTSQLYSTTCPRSYKRAAGLGCVKLIEDKLVWCDARKRCFADGADLINVRTVIEATRLESFLSQQRFRGYFTWTGLRRDSSTGMWLSTQGDVVASDAPVWNRRFPNARGDCAEWESTKRIQKAPCSSRHRSSVCQLPGS